MFHKIKIWLGFVSVGFFCSTHLACQESFFEKDHSEADLVLGELGFDDAGGPLLFNHPKGIATDGQVLMLADGNNHRNRDHTDRLRFVPSILGIAAEPVEG